MPNPKQTEEQDCMCHCHMGDAGCPHDCLPILTCSHCIPLLDTEAWEETISLILTEEIDFDNKTAGNLETRLIELFKNKETPGIKDNPQNTGNPGKSEDWENIFYKVYGKPIVELYEENWRLRHPGQPEGNIAFEGGMDFQSWIKQFIRNLLKNKESSTLQAVKEKVKALRNKKLKQVKKMLSKETDDAVIRVIFEDLDDVLKLIEE